MKARLDTQVATAIGSMLVGRDEITLEDAADGLPAYIRAANPSLKCITKALVGAGWITERRDGGSVVYVRPELHQEPAPAGHNAGGVAADEVRLLIERAERLEEEKKGLADDIKDVFAEAKSRGYDVKSIKGIIKIRKMPPEQRHEEAAMLEVYMRALGMMA